MQPPVVRFPDETQALNPSDSAVIRRIHVCLHASKVMDLERGINTLRHKFM
jgi:hypothetical protein